MKVAYVSTYDARDVAHWSGSGYFIWHSLARRGIEVEFIGPLNLPSPTRWMLKCKQAFHEKVRRDLYLQQHDKMAAQAYASLVSQRLSVLKNIDAVVSPGTIPVAYLTGTVPLVTVSDATHKLLFNSYPGYENLSPTTRRDGDQIERTALRRASASVFASDWAAESAVRDYQADPEKVHVVPFGANFEKSPSREEAICGIESRNFDTLQLLFIGVEWERKGGPAVMQVVRELVRRDVSVHLTVVGCSPEISAPDAKNVTVRGFIKKTPEGQREILGLLMRSHFLTVPSEAECYGLVYCEAGALGVPCIARRVGGVPTIIRDGRNGQLFEMDQSPVEMAEWMLNIFRTPAAYRQLALSSIDEFESRLNWDVAGLKLENILKKIIS